ncbi:hypothetical protein HZS61_010705 [Fusarium oxysporum f. sp. conglutinans]|uniref:Uncharacterized protein n=1 Tax=Fusarium oxysporum f. sp. conglutinans TaxID=100902 RepID=A0A8H6GWY4_FUSOX|nr:hypothetical protein HZS61_010705 [Fusarium oxysporum f. sp. conglutinans]
MKNLGFMKVLAVCGHTHVPQPATSGYIIITLSEPLSSSLNPNFQTRHHEVHHRDHVHYVVRNSRSGCSVGEEECRGR